MRALGVLEVEFFLCRFGASGVPHFGFQGFRAHPTWLGFRVWGLGFSVLSEPKWSVLEIVIFLGFRVQGLGLNIFGAVVSKERGHH